MYTYIYTYVYIYIYIYIHIYIYIYIYILDILLLDIGAELESVLEEENMCCRNDVTFPFYVQN